MQTNIIRKSCGAKYFLPPLVCAVATFIFTYQFALIEPDFYHDGLVLQSGVDLKDGRLPFRDSNQHYGLGEPFLAWMSVSFFGENILAVRKLAVGFYSVLAFMLWIVWRRLIPCWLNVLTFLTWLLMAPYLVKSFLPWASVHALLFQVVAIWWIIRFIEDGKIKYLFWAGLFCGGAWLCRWTVGIPLLVSIGFFLIITGSGGLSQDGSPRNSTAVWKQLLSVSSGFLVVIGPSFLFLVLTSSVKDFFIQTVSFHISTFEISGSPWRSVLRVPYCLFFCCETPWRFISLICLFLFMQGFYRSFTQTSELSRKDKISFLLATTGMASLLQYYPLPDHRHLYWASTPIFGLLSYAVWQQVVGLRKEIAIVASVAVIFLFFGNSAIINVQKGVTRLRVATTWIDKPAFLRGMKTSKNDALELEKLAQKMKDLEMTHPGKKVLVLHRDGVWNMLPQNALRFHKLFVRWHTLDNLYPDYQKNLDEVIKRKVPILLSITSPFPCWMPQMYRRLPEDYTEVFKTKFETQGNVVLALPKK